MLQIKSNPRKMDNTATTFEENREPANKTVNVQLSRNALLEAVMKARILGQIRNNNKEKVVENATFSILWTSKLIQWQPNNLP